jgi:hypothetical protein
MDWNFGSKGINVRKIKIAGLSILILIAFFAAACQPTVTNTPGVTLRPTVTDTLTPTMIATSSPIPSPTIEKTATPTKTSSLTPTYTPDILYLNPTIIYQEVDLESKYAANLTGSLIYSPADNELSYYLLDLRTYETQQIVGAMNEEAFISFPEKSVSPDRTMSLFFELIDSEKYIYDLRVIAADGSFLETATLPEGLGGFFNWLDNERIYLTEKNWDGIVHIFNIFTGEDQRLYPEWLDLPENEPLSVMSCVTRGGLYPNIVYDLNLDGAVYQILKDNNEYIYLYYDFESQEIVWNASVSIIFSEPIWSPIGDSFLITHDKYADRYISDYTGSLFTIDKAGNITHLSDKIIGCQSWSPDGSFIAAWYQGETVNSEILLNDKYLMVHDFDRNVMTVYDAGYPFQHQFPIWSQDGNMLAFTSYREGPGYDPGPFFQIFVVDLIENQAYSVIDDAFLVGWLGDSSE